MRLLPGRSPYTTTKNHPWALMDATPVITVEQFEVVKHSVQARIPENLWNMAVEAHEIEEFISTWIVTTCSWEVASKTTKNVLETPSDWWQHLKQRFAPGWFLERWPVLVNRYHARHFYPDIKVPVAQLRRSYSSFEMAIPKEPHPSGCKSYLSYEATSQDEAPGL